MKNRDLKFYIFIVLAVMIYWAMSYRLPFEEFTKRITTSATLIAAVAFWLQFKRTERLNESNYIMNLNQQFITNKDMCFVEHQLELYYNQYEVKIKGKKELPNESLQEIHLGINQSRTSDECQMLINYLVYLEALAALVDRQVIHLQVIDDLFAYRFFLATNNPVVQQDELFPYADYYQGIYKLSKKWIEKANKQNISNYIKKRIENENCRGIFKYIKKRIEDENCRGIYIFIKNRIEKTNMTIPMKQYNLPEMYEKWKKNHLIIPLDISQARSSDSKTAIAKCLYETDKYIYPEAFGDDCEKATRAISRIIGMEGSLLDYKNLLVARFNGQVCGVCLLSDGKSVWDSEKIRERIGKDLLPESLLGGFTHASEDYFERLKDNSAENMIELVTCCVDEGFRRKYVASAMLSELIHQYNNTTIRLTVLESNTAAIRLYKQKGFSQIGDSFDGFAPAGLRKPLCIVMERTYERER